jgi:hypothetical protein
MSHPPFILSLSKDRSSFDRGAQKDGLPFDKLRANGDEIRKIAKLNGYGRAPRERALPHI